MPRLFAFLLLLPVAATGPAPAAQDAGEEKYEEVLKSLVDNLGRITKTLEKIVDEDSAKASRMELRELAAGFIATRKKSEELSPPSTETRDRLANKYRPIFEKSRKTLVAQIARVERVPGGNAVLQEIRGVFEKNEP